MKLSPRLIIIAGPPRSGTTLANRILCTSPECAPFLPECSFLTRQIEQYSNILNYADKERFSAYFSTEEECRSCFEKCVGAHFESLMKARPEVAGHEYIVLKDPMLSFNLLRAQELLPAETRFVITIRNPLAVMASMKKVESRRGSIWDIKTKVDEIFNFYFHLNRVREEARIVSACYVRYEDMVTGQWGSLESFLGFSLSDEFMHVKHKRDIDKTNPFYTPLYEKSVSNERIDAWKDELSDFEISYVRDVFSGVMAYWQYT
jgi:hypothetical protein